MYIFVLEDELVVGNSETEVKENDVGIEDNQFDSENNRQNRLIENVKFSSSTGIPYTPKSRKKRSLSSEYIVELMVVADKKMADYHGEGLHNYILTLMSSVSQQFHLGADQISSYTKTNLFKTINLWLKYHDINCIIEVKISIITETNSLASSQIRHQS